MAWPLAESVRDPNPPPHGVGRFRVSVLGVLIGGNSVKSGSSRIETMSSIAKTLGLVVFSALLSVSGTVAVMNYAPSLVPMPMPPPEISISALVL